MSPGGTSRSIPSTAVTDPYRLVSPTVRMAAVTGAAPPAARPVAAPPRVSRVCAVTVPVSSQLRRLCGSVNSSDSGPTAIRTPSPVWVAPGVLVSCSRSGREIRPGSGTATSSVSPDPYVPTEPRPDDPRPAGQPGQRRSVGSPGRRR